MLKHNQISVAILKQTNTDIVPQDKRFKMQGFLFPSLMQSMYKP